MILSHDCINQLITLSIILVSSISMRLGGTSHTTITVYADGELIADLVKKWEELNIPHNTSVRSW